MDKFNCQKFEDLVSSYTADFDSWWESKEKILTAFSQFHKHWDLNRSDFIPMYHEATCFADQLLICDNKFPEGMIISFAKMAEHTTKQAFVDLLDESQDLALRVDTFNRAMQVLLRQFAQDNPNWTLDTKQSQSISTYLYCAYPSKYFIYNKDDVKAFTSALSYPLKITSELKGSDLIAIYQFFGYLKERLASYSDLIAKASTLLKAHEIDSDPANLVAWDLCYYYCHQARS